MSNYLKLFDTHSEYQTYAQSGNILKPNVSYCKDNNEVYYNPIVPETRLIAKFNVTTTSSPTSIMNNNYGSTYINKIWIDDIEQQNVISSYTFLTTGEHEVKYELIIPTIIGDQIFGSCSNLTNIIIPNNVITIGDLAFSSCENLLSITIGDNVTSIGENAFNQCSSLTSIVISNSITNIGSYSFMMCRNLSSVTINATTPPTCGYYVWEANSSNRKIYVPSESVNAYKAASGWSTYANAIEAIS